MDKQTTDKSRPRPKANSEPPCRTWQRRGREFVVYAQGCLWDRAGDKALAWLQVRGLADDTIRHFGLGYNPADLWDEPYKWNLEGRRLWLPRGIVIPCEKDNMLWYVKIRRPVTDRHKYIQIRGSKAALFGINNLGNENRLLLFCKGELDTMLAWQEVGNLVDVATLCSVAKLAAQGRRVIRIAMADGGDLTDFCMIGGNLRGLLAEEIARHTREAETGAS